MEETPTGSDTISVVEKFRNGKKKRETKRKEARVITTHVPPLEDPVPEPVPEEIPSPAPESPPPPPPPVAAPKAKKVSFTDMEGIADKVAEMILSKVEKKTPKVRTAPAPAPAPPTKSFGWC